MRKMAHKVIYSPHPRTYFTLLVILLTIVAILFFFGFIGIAFEKIGLSSATVIIILVGTLVGSLINIPLFKIRSSVPIVRTQEINFYGLTFRIPTIREGVTYTTVSINLGGAIIPIIVSTYIILKNPDSLFYGIVSIAIVALATHLVSKPRPGIGIVSPAFIPPIVAALSALLLPVPSLHQPIVAYVGGVMGTLIGADLTNLHRITGLGAPVASIGGAGTFDGIFLSGIIAAILS
jgi:uncharacterized membrane protein